MEHQHDLQLGFATSHLLFATLVGTTRHVHSANRHCSLATMIYSGTWDLTTCFTRVLASHGYHRPLTVLTLACDMNRVHASSTHSHQGPVNKLILIAAHLSHRRPTASVIREPAPWLPVPQPLKNTPPKQLHSNQGTRESGSPRIKPPFP